MLPAHILAFGVNVQPKNATTQIRPGQSSIQNKGLEQHKKIFNCHTAHRYMLCEISCINEELHLVIFCLAGEDQVYPDQLVQ